MLTGLTTLADAALLPHFNRPAWLYLIIPLCALAWWGARRKRSEWSSSTRRAVYLTIRCTVIALICAALAEPSVRWRADDVAVIAVVDTSDSVPAAQKSLARDFLAGSLTKRPENDRFGLVTVARNPVVQTVPTDRNPGLDAPDTGEGDASNLSRGIELARSLLPSDAAGRILLISDGNETAGSLATAATRFAGSKTPVDVASVEYDRSATLRVENIDVPPWARDGDTITARVVINAGAPTSARLTILLDGQPVDLDPDAPGFSTRVDLSGGRQVLSQLLRLPPGPFHRAEAVLEPDNASGAITQLLRAEAVTFTSSKGRILVLAEDPTAAAPFVEAVSSDNVKVDILPSSSAPHTVPEWAAYDAVVLFDQAAYNFTQEQQTAMLRFVHDTGGGMLVIGGPNSYGAGGWIGSPLADAFPVKLDPPQKRQMPMGALAIIIDHSGSMAQPVPGTGMNQQQIANNSAVLGIRALSRLDQVAVIEFDSAANVVVPLTEVSNPDEIARKVHAIGPSGGTYLYPALDLAAAELEKSKAGVKHIIVLTDGETTGEPREGFDKVGKLRARNITLSTVAIGDSSNSPLLARLAQIGGGRNYNVDSASTRDGLPQIFIKEAQTVRRALIWEGPAFSPALSTFADSLRGISTPLPPVTGYVVTADRGGLSTISLRGPEGDPILAQWQHGLGRVTAFTSDAAPRWNAAWKGWNSFQPFWEQQVKWLLRPTGDANARIAVDTSGDRAKITLELSNPDGERVNFANISARVASPDADAPPLDVTFRQTGPGRYEAETDAKAVGTHMLSMRYETPGSAEHEARTGTVRAAITRRAGDEFRRTTPDTNLLWSLARSTGGRIYHLDKSGVDLWVREQLAMPEMSRPIWLHIAILAITMFLVDAAVRRVSIDPARVKAGLASLTSKAPETPAMAMATLAAAKSRANTKPEPDRHTRAQAHTPERIEPTFEPTALTPQRETPAPIVNANPSAPTADDAGDAMARLRAAKSRSLPPNDQH